MGDRLDGVGEIHALQLRSARGTFDITVPLGVRRGLAGLVPGTAEKAGKGERDRQK